MLAGIIRLRPFRSSAPCKKQGRHIQLPRGRSSCDSWRNSIKIGKYGCKQSSEFRGSGYHSQRQLSSSHRVIAELDCLVSLAKASANMDEPKCRPVFIESDSAFIDFQELRHPSMCLRADFIANDVRLGSSPDDRDPDGMGDERQVLLTGPNMAGKSTLLRMTAAGIIMAQMGCYVPARQARLSPVDKIQTRMGAYDSECVRGRR